MGENVLIIACYTLSVKAVRGIQVIRHVIGSLKVVFSLSQNETYLEVVWLSEPLITRVTALCLNMKQCPILRQHFYCCRLYCFIFR